MNGLAYQLRPRASRFFLVLATLALVVFGLIVTSGAAPAQAQSANGVYDTDGDGLIEISNLEQLNALRFDTDGNGRADDSSNLDDYATGFPLGDNELVCDRNCNGYELTRSLDFNDAGSYASGQVVADWTRDAGWTPILGFNATFDGMGHTISNLYMDATLSNQSSIGLFGSIQGSAVIRDIGLLNVEVTGMNWMGGLVGYNYGEVSHSYATGTVSGVGISIGGLVGGNTGTVSHSYATGTVTSSGSHSSGTGGLVGYNQGTVSHSYATGTVSGVGRDIGGLVGYSTDTVSHSYATGTVSGNQYVGGLVGYNRGSVISLSYATGPVTSNRYVGGLAGGSFSWQDSPDGRAFIRSSYATGSVTGGSEVGGLVGVAGYCDRRGFHLCDSEDIFSDEYYSTIIGSYAIGAVSGGSRVGGLVGYGERRPDTEVLTVVEDSYRNTDIQAYGGWGTGKTTAELQEPTGRTGIYAGWSSRNWDFGSSSQYPALKVDLDGDGTATAYEFGGQGREAPPMPPGAAAIASVTPGSGSLTVSWRAPSGGAGGITAYDLRHIPSGDDETVDANWTVVGDIWTGSGPLQYALTGLTGGVQYGVQVRAVNSVGDGPWSATATGTPAQAAGEASATRSFSAATVAPGGQVTVTVTAANYGGFGVVAETLPSGFSYVSSTHDSVTHPVDGNSQKVAFTLLGDASFTYTVAASGVEGLHAFSGTLTDSAGNIHTVGGDTTVTVGDAPPGVTVSYAGTGPTAAVRIGTAIPVAAAFTKTVTGFTVDDVRVGNGAAGNFSGSGAAYTFDVTPKAIGQVTVDIGADVAEDADGNGNTAAAQLRLGIPYDDNRNGVIERGEVIRAINDYLGAGSVERSHVIALINLYLSGQ